MSVVNIIEVLVGLVFGWFVGGLVSHHLWRRREHRLLQRRLHEYETFLAHENNWLPGDE